MSLDVRDGIDIPIYVIVGFMQRDDVIQQHQDNDSFRRPSAVNAQCIIGSHKFPDAEMNCNHAIDKYAQAYGKLFPVVDIWLEIMFYNHILHKKISKLLIIIRVATLVIFYVFDIRHHQIFSAAQPINVRFDFRPAAAAATNLVGYALLLTNKLVSVISDGQRQSDLF